jgi:hypothetical protein
MITTQKVFQHYNSSKNETEREEKQRNRETEKHTHVVVFHHIHQTMESKELFANHFHHYTIPE